MNAGTTSTEANINKEARVSNVESHHTAGMNIERKEGLSIGNLEINAATTAGHPEKTKYAENEDGVINSEVTINGKRFILAGVIDEAGGQGSTNRGLIKDYITHQLELKLQDPIYTTVTNPSQILQQALLAIHHDIRKLNEAQLSANNTELGQAALAVALVGEDNKVYAASIGDPMIYINNSQGNLQPIPGMIIDHDPGQPINVVSQLVGMPGNVNIHTYPPIQLSSGQKLLLTSDGVSAAKEPFDTSNQLEENYLLKHIPDFQSRVRSGQLSERAVLTDPRMLALLSRSGITTDTEVKKLLLILSDTNITTAQMVVELAAIGESKRYIPYEGRRVAVDGPNDNISAVSIEHR